jgi:hypothetical protein
MSPYENVRQRQKDKQDKIYSILGQEIQNVQQDLEIMARRYGQMEKRNKKPNTAERMDLTFVNEATNDATFVRPKKEPSYASFLMYNSY